MSSILKALRKIGEEKRIDQHAAPDLRLDQGVAAVASKPFLPLLTGIALGAVIVGLIFLWMQRGAEPVAKAQVVSEAKQVVAGGGNSVDSASIVSASPTINFPGQSLKDLAEASKVSVVTLSPDPVVIAESIDTVIPKSLPNPPVKRQKQAETLTLVSKPATTTQTSSLVAIGKTTQVESSELPEGISLTVEEIFYQDDNANSMAVVNDLPVMIGSQVDSAAVTEIRPDSVLFKINGKAYVVALSLP